MKAGSLRWGIIVPWGAFVLTMLGLTIYRLLRASDGDTSKAFLLFGISFGALCGAVLLVVFLYRRAAMTARGLLDILDGRYPGHAFAIFKTVGLQDDIATLPLSLRGEAWNKGTMYAVVTLDAEWITFWDGSAKKPVITAQLSRSEVRSINATDEVALLFNAKALKVAVSHDGVMLRVTFALARPRDWIFFPATDSLTVLESALTSSASAPTSKEK